MLRSCWPILTRRERESSPLAIRMRKFLTHSSLMITVYAVQFLPLLLSRVLPDPNRFQSNDIGHLRSR